MDTPHPRALDQDTEAAASSNPDVQAFVDRQPQIDEIQELRAAGFDNDDILTYINDNPEFSFLFAANTAVDTTLRQVQMRARGILKSGRAMDLPNYGKLVGDMFLNELDHPMNIFDLMTFIQTHSLHIASLRRGLEYSPERAVKVDDTIEAGLCNVASAYLLSQANLDLMGNQAEERVYENFYTPQVLEELNTMFYSNGIPGINLKFLSSKLEMTFSEIGPLRSYQMLLDTIKPTDQTEQETREAGQRNQAFARKLQKIRSYGIKPLAFPAGEALPGVEIIYSAKDRLEHTSGLKNDDVFAFAQLTDPSAGDERFKHERLDSPYVDGSKVFGTYCLLSIDSNGELYLGASPTYDGVPLRARADKTGQLAQYELLRGTILNDLFAAIAPATIVERLRREEETIQVNNQPEERAPSDVVYPLRLPRIKYLDQPFKTIRQDIGAAETQETAETLHDLAGHKRLHIVAPFLRPLPFGARASAAAIQRSKQAFGDNFKIPDGYTFVKEHKRGDQQLGTVIGYTAVTSHMHGSMAS